MEKDPEKRPASPAALRQQLEAALAEAPPAAAAVVPRSPVAPIAVVASGDTLAPPPGKTSPGVTMMPARTKLPWAWIGGGAAALVALVLISAYAREHARADRKPSPPAVTEGLGDVAGAAAAPVGPPGHVRVLAQNASSARFYIDDRLVASGAREADLPTVAPDRPHVLRVEADGLQPALRRFTVAAGGIVEIQLALSAAPKIGETHVEPPPASPATSPPPAHGPGHIASPRARSGAESHPAPARPAHHRDGLVGDEIFDK
jgi:hypothetical protein